jgi:xylose isomerase
LTIAAAIRAEGEFDRFVRERYSSFDSGIGADIESGKADFRKLEAYILTKGDAAPNRSGRQEMLEHLLNRYI